MTLAGLMHICNVIRGHLKEIEIGQLFLTMWWWESVC